MLNLAFQQPIPLKQFQLCLVELVFHFMSKLFLSVEFLPEPIVFYFCDLVLLLQAVVCQLHLFNSIFDESMVLHLMIVLLFEPCHFLRQRQYFH